MPKKKNKRSKVKYPGLNRGVNGKLRQEYMDQEYADKLSPEDKQWLSNFNEEYFSGNTKHPGKVLNKSKKRKKECYDRNNARNRCQYSVSKATGYLYAHQDYLVNLEKSTDIDHEGVIAEFIDLADRTPIWLTPKHWEAIEKIYKKSVILTKKTGKKHVVSFIVPLDSKDPGGIFVPDNMKVTCEEDEVRHR